MRPTSSSAAASSVSNVTVRRSVIIDAYSAGAAHSQGLYADLTNGLVLEEH